MSSPASYHVQFRAPPTRAPRSLPLPTPFAFAFASQRPSPSPSASPSFAIASAKANPQNTSPSLLQHTSTSLIDSQVLFDSETDSDGIDLLADTPCPYDESLEERLLFSRAQMQIQPQSQSQSQAQTQSQNQSHFQSQSPSQSQTFIYPPSHAHSALRPPSTSRLPLLDGSFPPPYPASSPSLSPSLSSDSHTRSRSHSSSSSSSSSSLSDTLSYAESQISNAPIPLPSPTIGIVRHASADSSLLRIHDHVDPWESCTRKARSCFVVNSRFTKRLCALGLAVVLTALTLTTALTHRLAFAWLTRAVANGAYPAWIALTISAYLPAALLLSAWKYPRKHSNAHTNFTTHANSGISATVSKASPPPSPSTQTSLSVSGSTSLSASASASVSAATSPLAAHNSSVEKHRNANVLPLSSQSKPGDTAVASPSSSANASTSLFSPHLKSSNTMRSYDSISQNQRTINSLPMVPAYLASNVSMTSVVSPTANHSPFVQYLRSSNPWYICWSLGFLDSVACIILYSSAAFIPISIQQILLQGSVVCSIAFHYLLFATSDRKGWELKAGFLMIVAGLLILAIAIELTDEYNNDELRVHRLSHYVVWFLAGLMISAFSTLIKGATNRRKELSILKMHITSLMCRAVCGIMLFWTIYIPYLGDQKPSNTWTFFDESFRCIYGANPPGGCSDTWKFFVLFLIVSWMYELLVFTIARLWRGHTLLVVTSLLSIPLTMIVGFDEYAPWSLELAGDPPKWFHFVSGILVVGGVAVLHITRIIPSLDRLRFIRKSLKDAPHSTSTVSLINIGLPNPTTGFLQPFPFRVQAVESARRPR
eukprot:TRINITY_DN5455_c1_g1_i2.p1 TRINITY_DN5455_c1_g1~~TRINITY_DN5455_c1_g1_i2.p1  ORF type:complete len:823 (+),score=150.15 TRINITY_DN5455_c1_g1_i2:62-2530(+)